MVSTKLEIYQIGLNPVKRSASSSFREFLSLLYPIGSGAPSDSSLFGDLLRLFITKADTDQFIKDERSKKAFAAYDTRPTESISNPSVSLLSERSAIYGFVEGGPYGRSRNTANVDNKASKETIPSDSVISTRFFFLFHAPLGSKTGILFLQSYSGETISSVFVDFMRDILSLEGSYKKAKAQKYIPSVFKEQVKENSTIKALSYTKDCLGSEITSEPEFQQETDIFTVKVTITSKRGRPKTEFRRLAEVFANTQFAKTVLSAFKGRVRIEDERNAKSTSFDIDRDFDISPIIYLDDLISHDAEGRPNIEELRDYCLNLLETQIRRDVYPNESISEC